MPLPTRYVDAFVIGGGPAGLAAAIALRAAGMSVHLADAAEPPIDKACGEGLMPAGIAALAELGITVPAAKSYPLRGIRFCARGSAVSARFGRQAGLGVRRTALHDALVERAGAEGVRMMWGTRAELLPQGKVMAAGREWSPRWTIGADGQGSRVRKVAGLDPARHGSARYGFRRHFAVAPWTDCVEVHWAPEGQAYVTPTGEAEICIALVMEDQGHRMANLHSIFPALAERLSGAEPSSRERGALTVCRSLPRVTRGSIALIGEAAGSIDAITGEGLTLAFQQAPALADALAKENPDLYEKEIRRIRRRPATMSRLLVFLGRHPELLEWALRASETNVCLFARLVAAHVGTQSAPAISAGALASFGWSFVLA